MATNIIKIADKTTLDAIQSLLNNSTYGLSAIKTQVNKIPTTSSSGGGGGYSSSVTKSLITTREIVSRTVSSSRYGIYTCNKWKTNYGDINITGSGKIWVYNLAQPIRVIVDGLVTHAISKNDTDLNYITFVKSLKIMQGNYDGVVLDSSICEDTGDTTNKDITEIAGYRAPTTYLSGILIHLK